MNVFRVGAIALAGLLPVGAWGAEVPRDIPKLPVSGGAAVGGVGAAGRAAKPPAAPIRKFLAVEEATVQAVKKWQQTGRAKPIVGDDGVVLFPFGQYQPKIVCSPERVCDIALKPGEKVTGVPSAGNTVQWNIFQAESGIGDKKQVHVVVTPRDVNLETNLIVRTDQRTYHMTLVSRADGEYLGQVGFYYPTDMTEAWAIKSAEDKLVETKKAANNVAELNVDLGKIDRAYTVTGGDEKTRPTLVFNDGKQTYIQLPWLVKVMEQPVFAVIGKDDKKLLTTFRSVGTDSGTWLIVDKLFDHGVLLSGADGEDGRVDIVWKKNNGAVRGWSLFGSNPP